MKLLKIAEIAFYHYTQFLQSKFLGFSHFDRKITLTDIFQRTPSTTE